MINKANKLDCKKGLGGRVGADYQSKEVIKMRVRSRKLLVLLNIEIFFFTNPQLVPFVIFYNSDLFIVRRILLLLHFIRAFLLAILFRFTLLSILLPCALHLILIISSTYFNPINHNKQNTKKPGSPLNFQHLYSTILLTLIIKIMTLRKLYPSQNTHILSELQTKTNSIDYYASQHERFSKKTNLKRQDQEQPQKFRYLDPSDGAKQWQKGIDSEIMLKRRSQKDLCQQRNCDAEMKFSFNREWQTNISSNWASQNRQIVIDGPFLSQDRENQRKKSSEKMSYSIQPMLKQDYSNPLKQVHNTLQTRKNSVGSIKRNRKEILSDVQGEREKKSVGFIGLDDIESIRMSKLKQMNEKLNRVLSKQNIVNDKIHSLQLQDELKVNLVPLQQNPRLLQSKIQPLEASPKLIPRNIVPYLERLFDYLDKNKVGMLSQSNCNASTIPEELKFAFGHIFTKIIIKNLSCNKRQFIKLCLNALKEIEKDQIPNILYHRFPEDSKDKYRVLQKSLIDEAQPKTEEIHLADTMLQYKWQPKLQKTNNYHQSNERRRYHEIEEPPVAAQIAKEIHLQPIQNKLYPISKEYSTLLKAPSKQSFNQNSKCGGISESVLMQHRKSLQQLNNLDLMVSKILNTKHLGDNMVGECQSQSLQFGQLVKHI